MRVPWRSSAELSIGRAFLDEVVLQDDGADERGQHVVVIDRLGEVLDEEVGVAHVRKGLHLCMPCRIREHWFGRVRGRG